MPFHVLAALPLVIKFGHNFAFSFHIWYTRTTICNEIDMSSSTHKINALNILANYNSQITFQTPKFPFFQNFNRVFTAKLSPATTKLTRHKFNSFMNPPPLKYAFASNNYFFWTFSFSCKQGVSRSYGFGYEINLFDIKWFVIVTKEKSALLKVGIFMRESEVRSQMRWDEARTGGGGMNIFMISAWSR